MVLYKELQEEIELSIKGVNRYNPNNIESLEECISLMVKENHYHKDILLTTLKLYQFNQDRYKQLII